MKNLNVLFILFLLFSNSSFSQNCLSNGIIFSSQVEIDDFPSQYPNCTEILGNVKIRGSVNNLDSLINLTSIGGDLLIDSTATLETLIGLNNVAFIGGDFKLRLNENLQSISTMDSLSTLVGELFVVSNDVLPIISGFENLTSSGRMILGRLPQLVDVSGFNNLELMGGSLFIGENGNQIQVTGFSGLKKIMGEFSLRRNKSLIDLSGFNNLEEIEDVITFEDLGVTNFNDFISLDSVQLTLRIDNNKMLTSLSGLDNLTSLTGGLSITYNDILNNLTGIQNITTLGSLGIGYNNSMTNFNGLENITSISEGFSIYNNPILTSIAGIENIDVSTINDFGIFSNPMLAICNVAPVCQFLSIGGFPFISNNAPGCKTGSEVVASCQLPCLTDITFSSQSDVYRFPNIYPNCREVEGDIIISGFIYELDSLIQLTNIGGELNIYDCYMESLVGLDSLITVGNSFNLNNNHYLTHLTGLEGLDSVGGAFSLLANYRLSSLNGLNNLQKVGGNFYIGTMNSVIPGYEQFHDLTGLEGLTTVGGNFLLQNLYNLTDLSGFENLDSVGGSFSISQIHNLESLAGLEWMTHLNGNLGILFNQNLTNLDGLENLEEINGELQIYFNEKLTNMDGIANVDANTVSKLLLHENSLLEICNQNSICDFLNDEGEAFIINNAPGCNSENEILATCLPDCPTDIIFSTQAEVDNFLNLYPNCSEILGNVKIRGAVENLDSLIQLTAIGGNLRIDTCNILETLIGLENLTNIGGYLEVSHNSNLTYLNGLEGLTKVGLSAAVYFNRKLSSLNGLNNLDSVGSDLYIGNMDTMIAGYPPFSDLTGLEGLTFVGGSFLLYDLDYLTNLSGFENLNNIGGNLLIERNKRLKSLAGLEWITHLGNSINIDSNDSLASFMGLENLESIDGDLNIIGNFQLDDLSALSNLTSIEDALRIFGSYGLPSLEDFSNLTNVQEIKLQDNPLFTSLSGLENVNTTNLSNLQIELHPLLAICNEPNICDYLLNGGAATIANNATGCNTQVEVEASCTANSPGSSCSNPIIVDDLDGYTNMTSGTNNQDEPTTFCGIANNNQWIAFMAGTTNIVLDVVVGICNGASGGTGLQAQVFSECGTPWEVASNCLYEISPNETQTLILNNLTVGNVYYLMLDGFAGDICAYSIEVTSGSTVSPTIGNCPEEIDGFTTLGEFANSKYYLSNDPFQPIAAQDLAETFGGYLTTISSTDENDFIQQNISEMVYIGLNDFDLEGNLVWKNGEPLNYNNINPCGFCNENSADQDFVIMAPWDGAWSFSNVFNSRKFVLEIPCGGAPVSEITLACSYDINVILSNGDSSIVVDFPNPTASTTCDGGAITIEQISGYTSGTSLVAGTYSIAFQATDTCGNIENCTFQIIVEPEIILGECPEDIIGFTTLGEFGDSKYYLSNDISRATDAQLEAIAYGGYLTTISSQGENDFIQQNISEMVYIGLNDYDSEGNLEWFNGEPFTFNNINPCGFCNENGADQDFVIMAPWDGAWSFSNFFNSRKFVMEIPCGGNSNGDIIVNCPVEQFIEVDSGATEAIIIYDEITATTTCPDGGLTINLISGPAIGELKSIGKYTIIYSITDACGNSKQCLFIVNVVPSSNGGCPNSLADFTFMGEFGNSAYFISDEAARPTDAQAIAIANGGNLAIINSQDENDFIANQINGLVYIGLDDFQTEGQPTWIDGSGNAFTNFDICNFCNENSEEMDFVVMHSWNGAWSWSNFYNARKYIVEIPCSATLNNPNNNFSLIVQSSNEDSKPTLERLVPNPAMDFIFVEINSSQEVEVEIMIYDARGSFVKMQRANLYIGANAPMIDISELPAGFYSIYLPQAKTKFATQRFVKVRD